MADFNFKRIEVVRDFHFLVANDYFFPLLSFFYLQDMILLEYKHLFFSLGLQFSLRLLVLLFLLIQQLLQVLVFLFLLLVRLLCFHA